MGCNSWPFTEQLECLNRLKKFRGPGSHGSLCISVPLMLYTKIPQCLIEYAASFQDVSMLHSQTSKPVHIQKQLPWNRDEQRG
jgi:hypothetical protein